MRNKNVIRLSESELHTLVTETVKHVLNELDWRTYQSASEKDKNPGRSSRFRQAANNAFNRQNGYGLQNIPYGDGDDTQMTAKGTAYAGGNMYHADGGDGFDTYSGNVGDDNEMSHYYSRQRIGNRDDYNGRRGFVKGNRGQSIPVAKNDLGDKPMKTSFNPALKMKQMQGDKQVRDYFNGKSKYVPGKGWK